MERCSVSPVFPWLSGNPDESVLSTGLPRLCSKKNIQASGKTYHAGPFPGPYQGTPGKALKKAGSEGPDRPYYCPGFKNARVYTPLRRSSRLILRF
jgi:hypothetical protein